MAWAVFSGRLNHQSQIALNRNAAAGRSDWRSCAVTVVGALLLLLRHKIMNIKFKSPFEFKPGIIVSLLERSYAQIFSSDSKYWNQEKEKWTEFDKEVFQHPDTVGACVFLTLADDQLAGFGSYDNRPMPEFGIIGHNCILPEFRGRGHGKQQICEILNRFRSMGIKKAKVTTCSHPFFAPAQRLYISCGFIEINRRPWDMDSSQDIIEYEREIG